MSEIPNRINHFTQKHEHLLQLRPQGFKAPFKTFVFQNWTHPCLLQGSTFSLEAPS